MRAGRLRQRVIVLAPSATGTAQGENRITFSTAATVWGGVEPVRGSELVRNHQSQAEMVTRIVVRADAMPTGFNETYRMSHGGETYIIEAISDGNKLGAVYEIMAKTIAP